jgi:hypothetical protein
MVQSYWGTGEEGRAGVLPFEIRRLMRRRRGSWT